MELCIICNSIVVNNKCKNCFHIYNEIPDFYKMFSLFIILNYYKMLKIENCPSHPTDIINILDINSNFDTSLLLSFNKLEFRKSIVVSNEENLDKLLTKFDIIIVRDIFSSCNSPHFLLTAIKTLMNKDCLLLIQQPKDVYSIKNCYNTNSMNRLCNINGLYLNNIYNDFSNSDVTVFLIKEYICKDSNLIEKMLYEMDLGFYE